MTVAQQGQGVAAALGLGNVVDPAQRSAAAQESKSIVALKKKVLAVLWLVTVAR